MLRSFQNTRNLKSATLSNHVSSILYAVKMLHSSEAPEYRRVAVINQLRSQASQLQREGDRERPQTKEDLAEKGKWLEWYVALLFLFVCVCVGGGGGGEGGRGNRQHYRCVNSKQSFNTFKALTHYLLLLLLRLLHKLEVKKYYYYY